MKTLFSLLALLLVMGFAQAGDVSCQVDVLKPKMNPIIKDEAEKPADLTVAEARVRLKNRQKANQQETVLAKQEQKQQTEKDEPAEKESGLGSMFDILLPSKLRNPVQK